MVAITNPAGLTMALKNIAASAFNAVAPPILELLQNQIDIDVYGIGDPTRYPNWYYHDKMHLIHSKEPPDVREAEPTFQFKNAFKWTGIDRTSNTIKNKIFYDWESMDYDPSSFLHGSFTELDMRERLAEQLNLEGRNPPEADAFWYKLRYPYWDNFISLMFDADILGDSLDEKLRELGLTKI